MFVVNLYALSIICKFLVEASSTMGLVVLLVMVDSNMARVA